MKKSVYEVLIEQGFVLFPNEQDNLISAPKAFFGIRAIEWIRNEALKPEFDLHAYIVALTYYKLGMADLKFEGNELLYRYRGISFEGADNESNKDNPKITSKFHRPGDTLNSDGTITRSPYNQKPPPGDE